MNFYCGWRIKSIILFILFTGLLVSPAFGLRPSETAIELKPIKWLNGATSQMGKQVKLIGNIPQLRVVVFLLTNAVNNDQTIPMLQQLSRKYGSRVRFTLITPDPEFDAKIFCEKYNLGTMDFGVDYRRQITPRYMGGSLLYPFAFIINNEGLISWSGEAMDLPEMVDKFRAGKIKMDIQAQVASLVDELPQLIRDPNDLRMKQICNKIFSLDPGNPTALRMRLYVLEGSERIDEAWQLVSQQIAKCPKNPRVHFSGLDLILRHKKLRKFESILVKNFQTNINDFSQVSSFALALLEGSPYQAKSLELAWNLIERPQYAPEKLSGISQAERLDLGARLRFHAGDSTGALAWQEKAIIAWKKWNGAAVTAAEQRRDFFRCGSKIRKIQQIEN